MPTELKLSSVDLVDVKNSTGAFRDEPQGGYQRS